MANICVEIKTVCKSCGNPLPLNALAEKVPCASCQSVASFPYAYWKKSMLDSALNNYSELKEGEGQPQTVMTGEYTFNITYGIQKPRCRKCKTDLDVNKYVEFISAGKAVCEKCKNPVTARLLPEDAKPFFPIVKYLFGEDSDLFSINPSGKTEADVQNAAKPILFTCPSCAGNLKIDGSSRMITCTYCSSEIYLPDDLWMRLHPVKTVDRWYLVVDDAAVESAALEKLPDWYHIPGFTIDKDGNCYLASCDNYSENFIVWSFGRDLKTKWIRKGLKYDYSKTGICMTEDGNLYLWSGLKHSLLKLSSKDGSTISQIEGKPSAKDDPNSFNLLGCEQLVCNSDGSILALINNTVVRFNSAGKRIKLWNAKLFGLFPSGIGRIIPSDDEGSFPHAKDIFFSCPKRVDSGSTNMNLGWDGYLYMLDMSSDSGVLKLDTDGRKIKFIDVPLDYRECLPWVDKDGNLFIIGKNKDDRTNLIKISADGKNKQILLKDIKEGGVLNEEDKLALAPDGTVYLYSYYRSMKIFSHDMKMIYRSKQSETEDEKVRTEIKETIEKDEEIS